MRQIVFAFIALFLVIPCHAQETAGRSKILGIAYVKLKVTDMDKAQAFYGGALGLASMDVACHGFADACFTINAKQHIELVTTAPGTQGSYLAEIGLATDDVVKMRNYLTARGVAAGKFSRAPIILCTSRLRISKAITLPWCNWLKSPRKS